MKPSVSLTNLENYKHDIEYSITDANTKYINIMFEYLTNITENMNIKNTNYSKFIIIRGIETITHTFKHILYYTNNLDLTYFHSQSALYLYIEFITQITTERNIFLQLNSRDASMYVYKKTIFELDRTHCKTVYNSNKINTEHIKQINEFIELSMIIICFIINNESFVNINKVLIHNITNLCYNIVNMSLSSSEYSLCNLFIQKINISFDIIDFFLKKLKNKENNLNEIKLKLINITNEHISNYSTEKYINLLFMR